MKRIKGFVVDKEDEKPRRDGRVVAMILGGGLLAGGVFLGASLKDTGGCKCTVEKFESVSPHSKVIGAKP